MSMGADGDYLEDAVEEASEVLEEWSDSSIVFAMERTNESSGAAPIRGKFSSTPGPAGETPATLEATLLAEIVITYTKRYGTSVDDTLSMIANVIESVDRDPVYDE